MLIYIAKMTLIGLGLCIVMLLTTQCRSTSSSTCPECENYPQLWALPEGFPDNDRLVLKGEGVSVPGLKSILTQTASAKSDARIDAEQKAIQFCRDLGFPSPTSATDSGIFSESQIAKNLRELVGDSKIKLARCRLADGGRTACTILMIIEKTNIKKTCELAMTDLSSSEIDSLKSRRKTVYGVVYFDNQPAYIDSENLSNAFVWYESEEQNNRRRRSQSEARSLLWDSYTLTIRDGDTPRISFRYRARENVGYIHDGLSEPWRPIHVRVVQVGPRCKDSRGIFLQKVYLESDYFSGTFDVIQFFNKTPTRGLSACT
jgi:hypothetical protein